MGLNKGLVITGNNGNSAQRIPLSSNNLNVSGTHQGVSDNSQSNNVGQKRHPSPKTNVTINNFVGGASAKLQSSQAFTSGVLPGSNLNNTSNKAAKNPATKQENGNS